MASASPAADRIAREHRDRSGERFERVPGGTETPADTPANWRLSWDSSGRRQRGAGHGHGP